MTHWACYKPWYFGQDTYLCWNIKDFISYAKFRTNGRFQLEGQPFDIRVMEAFLDTQKECPATQQDAKLRLSEIFKHGNWSNLKKIYQHIHQPLITEVLPDVESLGLTNKMLKKRVFCHYTPEGQIYGRMKCQKAFKYTFNPHSLSTEEKQQLKPANYDEVILNFDFSSMEVMVFQWLSKDPVLGEIIEAGGNVYEGIWERLVGSRSADNPCKSIFLPIVFGLGSQNLADDHKISLNAAKKLIDGINTDFSVGMQWVEDFQNSPYVSDYFGRQRCFIENPYKACSFVIQSPAAIVCIQKLIKLHKNLENIAKVVYHCHDGYAILCKRLDILRVEKLALEILEAEEEMYPGLKLRARVE